MVRTLKTFARLTLSRSFLAAAPALTIIHGRHTSFGVFALVVLVGVNVVESIIRARS